MRGEIRVRCRQIPMSRPIAVQNSIGAVRNLALHPLRGEETNQTPEKVWP